jgi:hypothetical protein
MGASTKCVLSIVTLCPQLVSWHRPTNRRLWNGPLLSGQQPTSTRLPGAVASVENDPQADLSRVEIPHCGEPLT